MTVLLCCETAAGARVQAARLSSTIKCRPARTGARSDDVLALPRRDGLANRAGSVVVFALDRFCLGAPSPSLAYPVGPTQPHFSPSPIGAGFHRMRMRAPSVMSLMAAALLRRSARLLPPR